MCTNSENVPLMGGINFRVCEAHRRCLLTAFRAAIQHLGDPDPAAPHLFLAPDPHPPQSNSMSLHRLDEGGGVRARNPNPHPPSSLC